MLVFKILEDIIFLWTLLPMCGSKMRFEIGENQIDNQHPEPNSIANRRTFLLSDMRRHWRSLNNAAVWSDDICHGTLWSLFWKWSIMGGVENGTSARGERWWWLWQGKQWLKWWESESGYIETTKSAGGFGCGIKLGHIFVQEGKA